MKRKIKLGTSLYTLIKTLQKGIVFRINKESYFMKRRNRRGKDDNVNPLRFNVKHYVGFENVCSLRINWKEGWVHKKTGGIAFVPYHAYFDEDDVDKIMNYLYLWRYHKDDKAVIVGKEGIKMHRYIMNINDPKVLIHHLNTDVFMNSKRNLLAVNRTQHNNFHTILERIQDKGRFSSERLILEISENVISKMQETTLEEYELRLLEYERSLEETQTN